MPPSPESVRHPALKQPAVQLNKLRPPRLPALPIIRPQLQQRLQEAAERGVLLTLLRAPLGYGKSTLLAQYAAGLETPWAWLRCDSADNQPLVLLLHLHRALGLPPPDAPRDEASLWAEIVAHLERPSTRLTLILDDLQYLQARAACRYLDELLHHAPAGLQLIAACEGRPTLGLSHLRRDRHLLELDAGALALDSGEIRELAASLGQQLDSDTIYLMRAGSEGWISGALLGLAAHAEQPLPEPGNPRALRRLAKRALAHIGQFFDEELLRTLAPPQLQFMQRISVVTAFDAELATRLSGRQDAAELIRQLQRRDLFLQQRSGERLAFRFHPLLRRTLYQRLRQQAPEAIDGLHRQAADWLLAQRCYTEAVYQLGRARDFDELLKTIDRHSFDLLREGEVNAIVDFLADMPGSSGDDHFTLAITEASTLIVTNDVERTGACQRRLQRLLRRQGVPLRRPERAHQTLAFLRSRLAVLGGNFAHGVALVDSALQHYPQPSAATAVLQFNRGSCLFALGQLQQAREDIAQALAALEALEFSGYTNLLQLQLGLIDLAQGRSEQAGARFLDTGSAPRTFYDLFQHLGQGIVLLQQNRLEQAEQHLSQAEAIAVDFPHCAGLPWVLHYQAWRLVGLDQLPAARARWDEARRLARQFRLFALYRQVGACRARLAVREHDQDFILGWLDEWHWCRRHYGAELMPEEWLAYAWVQRHLGQHASARQIADNLHELAEQEDNQRLRLDLLLLDATLQRDAGDRPAALASLEQALQLAAQYGFGQLAQLEGRELSELLRQLLNPQTRRQLGLQQPLPAAERLASLLRGLHDDIGVGHLPLLEPLTRREQDVLRRMARGQGNQQIAEGLYISLSTVKTHINNLFRKLDANDRDGAVQAARALKLVD